MKSKETQLKEFKAIWKDEYLKWVCGFANSQGGFLFIGVNDNGAVVGVENAQKLLEDIPNKIVSVMGLVVNVDLKREGEKEFISVQIPISSFPVAYHGKYYYRSGTTLQELSGVALQDFLMKKMRLTWESQIVDKATMDDIDPDAIKYFIEKGISAKRLPLSARNDSAEIVLRNRMLIDSDDRLTLAALLLFGKNPQKYCITSGIKIGMFGLGYSDLETQDYIDGNLIQMADKIMQVLDNKYLIRPIHYEGMQRVEPLEIPIEGFREILYNAIVHKDYRGPEITIRVFKDRISITNEGPLPDGFTIDTLFQRHESKRRNELIAHAFYHAGFIEAWGRGFDKIRESFTKEGLKMPTVEENGRFFNVDIIREKYIEYVGKMSQEYDNAKFELTERQLDILKYIDYCDNADVTLSVTINASVLADKLNTTRRTIMRDINVLVLQGYIKRIGSKKKGTWIRIKDFKG